MNVFSSYFYIFYWVYCSLGKLWTFLLSFLCLLSTFLKINLGSLSCILGLYSQHSSFSLLSMGPWIFNFYYSGVLRSPGPPVSVAGLDGAYTYTHRDGILVVVVVVRSCGFLVVGYSCLSISSRAFCFFPPPKKMFKSFYLRSFQFPFPLSLLCVS